MPKPKKQKIDPKRQAWVAARQRHKLAKAHIQMARALAMETAREAEASVANGESVETSAG